MNFRQITLCILLWIFVVKCLAENHNSSHCERFCGQGTEVPYPFGFSHGCGIKLKCSANGTITIADFVVQNLTSEHILINLPPKCDRPLKELQQLHGPNFAMTWRNGLLLKNCSSPPIECLVPRGVMRSGFGLQGCDSGTNNESISCYTEANESESEFPSYERLKSSKCGVLFSSIALGQNENRSFTASLSGSQPTAVALELQRVELGWWVDGNCSCHSNATCNQVYKNSSYMGFRCQCKQGFTGDGFLQGSGCRKVHRCTASKYISGQCKGAKVGILVGGIIVGCTFVVALGLICCCIRRRSANLKKRLSAKRLLGEAAGGSSVPSFLYKEIERATNGFSEKQRLGTGAYGTVYAGKLHNDEWVAIKKIRHRDNDSIEQVTNEIKLLSSVSHPNLVRLLGCCIENGEQILVYEYMPNGTLAQHLQRERGSVLPWTTRLTIATETAHAIAHLHSAMNPPIYHRDIKSSNILLDYNFNSKVADFGLSRSGMMDDSHISTAPQGTPGYVDPQYHQNFHLSDKSDVYSFGVVLVEIITAKKVVDFSRPHSEINLAALAIDRIGKGCVDEIIDPYIEPTRDAWTLSSVHKVAELAFRCLAFHRDMRPSMMEVAEELEQIRLSGWAPLDENVGMDSSVASSCSSSYVGSENSFRTTMTKKGAVGSRRVVVPQRTVDGLSTVEEPKESSPVSVQDPWLSDNSSPSTNSLLGNVVQ